MNNALHKFAGALANATVRGRLTPTQAYAALAVRDIDNLQSAWASFVSHARWLNRRREEGRWEIFHVLDQMIRNRRPKNELLAEAHGVNGADGYYAENEISPLVAGLVRHALDDEKRRADWGRKRGI